ncbi:hypothetical protein WMY93_033746 [Mugilogobius chulae]|uniref:Uncharacterized protein n=1 Tax=Mugilogobius chulae TaxID=88201 RepID=A0AAW0MR09_9GOBI
MIKVSEPPSHFLSTSLLRLWLCRTRDCGLRERLLSSPIYDRKFSNSLPGVKPRIFCTKNDTTGFTPYELLFGRQPRLPIDLVFGLPIQKPSLNHSEYVQKLKSHLQKSYQLAAENAEKMMQKNKTRFDRKVIASELEVGDRVLVRNVRLRGKHKIADKWEDQVYVVVKKATNLPVYTVRPEHAEKPLRTLHRDLLLPCGYLPAVSQIPPVPAKRSAKSTVPSEDPEIGLGSSDDEMLPTHWYHLPTSEPARFSTTVTIPKPQLEPAPDTQSPLPESPAALPDFAEPPADPPPDPAQSGPDLITPDAEVYLPAETTSEVHLPAETAPILLKPFIKQTYLILSQTHLPILIYPPLKLNSHKEAQQEQDAHQTDFNTATWAIPF